MYFKQLWVQKDYLLQQNLIETKDSYIEKFYIHHDTWHIHCH